MSNDQSKRMQVLQLPRNEWTDQGSFYARVDGKNIGHNGRCFWETALQASFVAKRYLDRLIDYEKVGRRSPRYWCVSEWLDEVAGLFVPDPDMALVRAPSGQWYIVGDDVLEGREDTPDIEELTSRKLQAGDIVQLCYHEHRGHFTLTIADDGSWSLSGEMPEQVSHWWTGDRDGPLGDTIGDLVKNGDMEAGEHEIEAYYWSDEIAFRFEVETTPAGEFGRLVQVETH